MVKQVARYAAYFALITIMSGASVMETIYPFAFGTFFALVWCNEKISVLAPTYLLATVVASPTLITLIASISTITITIIMHITYTRARRKKKQNAITSITQNKFLAYTILSQIGYIIAEITLGAGAIHAIITVVIGVLFMLAAKTIAEVVIVRGLAYKLNPTEVISALFVLAAVSSGLTAIEIAGFELVKLAACVVILISALTTNITACILAASSFATGALIATGNTQLFAPLIIWALVASAFRGKHRAFAVIAVVITEAFLGLLLNVYYSYETTKILPVIIAGIITLALPKEVRNNLTNFFNLAENDIGMRNLVNRSRESLCRRLYNLGDVFAELDYVFRSMIKNSMSKQTAKSYLLSEVRAKVCGDCKNQHSCHRTCGQLVDSVLEGVLDSAVEKGRISVIDLPPYITTRCGRVSSLVVIINQLISEFAETVSNASGLDAGKMLIAEQLAGVSKIMKNLAGEVKRNISFDSTRENAIIDQLAFNNVVCCDAVIYEENQHVVSATLVVKKSDTNKKLLTTVVSKVCQHEMVVSDITSAARAGWNILTLVTKPKFEIAFGTASCKKNGSTISGDCYSIIRVTNDRYLLALCDGMGSGVKAERASSLAIGLVENFYKAGFDNDIILSSINKLLAVSGDDVFSALDVCVVDVRAGVCDFIKMGAAASLIRGNSQTTVVSGQALPLGIVHNVKPSISKQIIANGNMIFMVTDGISDCFESDDALRDYINNLPGVNPQTLAENVIEHCLALNNNYARDDMTIIVAKIY